MFSDKTEYGTGSTNLKKRAHTILANKNMTINSVVREFGIEPYSELGGSENSIHESLGEACRSLR